MSRYFPRRYTNHQQVHEKLLNITNNQANKKSKHLTSFRTPLYIKKIPPKQKLTHIGKDIEQLKHLCTVGGKAKWCNCYGRHQRLLLKKKKNLSRSTMWLRNPTFGYLFFEMKDFEELFALWFSLQHYLQYLRGENNLNTHLQMSR